MNCYVVRCNESHECAIIDPGADAKKILKAVEGYDVKFILLTHGHPDHIGALEKVRKKTGAIVCMHDKDAARFKIDSNLSLFNGDELGIGSYNLKVHHVPGHTAGQLSFDLQDGRIIVGDTVFVGGPGKTWSAEDFETTMNNLREIVFKWPDNTEFNPGHGPKSTIGAERPAFENFIRAGWEKGLFGDVAW